MTVATPIADLDQRFSSPEATPTAWTEARELLRKAEIYWLSTVRPDGRPHVTPLVAVWFDSGLYFCTALTSVRRGTSPETRASPSRPDATPSATVSTWWSTVRL